MLQRRLRGACIRKGYITEGDFAFAGEIFGGSRILLGRFLRKNFTHTSCRRCGPHRRIQYVGDHSQGEKHLGHIIDRCHETANLPAVLAAGKPQEYDDPGIDGQIDQRGKDCGNTHGGDSCPGKVLCRRLEFFTFLLLGAECLYHTYGGKKFPADFIEPVQLALQFPETGIA